MTGTVTMLDGPVVNVQAAAPSWHPEAVAGYVNLSGIGATYWPLVAAFPALRHLSITTAPGYQAIVGDCENGALTVAEALAYPVFYGTWSTVQALPARPPRLWVAHTGKGPHICGPTTCRLRWQADATQYEQNLPPGIDVSVCDLSLFDPTPAPHPPEEDMAKILTCSDTPNQQDWLIDGTPRPINQQAYLDGLVAFGIPIVSLPLDKYEGVLKGYAGAT